jgi:hypothetical protein
MTNQRTLDVPIMGPNKLVVAELRYPIIRKTNPSIVLTPMCGAELDTSVAELAELVYALDNAT